MTITTIHHQIATARTMLQACKDREKLTRAVAEQQAIASGAAGGKNAEERERSLAIALASNPDYQLAHESLRESEDMLAQLEADLESFRDARRQEEWSIRAALVDALTRRSIPSDAPGSDESFDDAADDDLGDAVWESTHGRYNGHVPSRPVDEDLPF